MQGVNVSQYSTGQWMVHLVEQRKVIRTLGQFHTLTEAYQFALLKLSEMDLQCITFLRVEGRQQ